jgi:ribosomal protein S18 acetylase RimI-like enzyme
MTTVAVDFRERVPPRIPDTTVATIASGVVGFVTVQDDEVEQIYVAESARGGGIANLLLRHAEQRIAVRFDTAWLAVVAGNTRARRFYERNGREAPGRSPSREMTRARSSDGLRW